MTSFGVGSEQLELGWLVGCLLIVSRVPTSGAPGSSEYWFVSSVPTSEAARKQQQQQNSQSLLWQAKGHFQLTSCKSP